jgi:hypothetical protein
LIDDPERSLPVHLCPGRSDFGNEARRQSATTGIGRSTAGGERAHAEGNEGDARQAGGGELGHHGIGLLGLVRKGSSLQTATKPQNCGVSVTGSLMAIFKRVNHATFALWQSLTNRCQLAR